MADKQVEEVTPKEERRLLKNFDKTIYAEVTKLTCTDEEFYFEFCTRLGDVWSVDSRIVVSHQHAMRIKNKIEELMNKQKIVGK
ncbi:hypothetical protein KJ762_11300 [bacterium]|nr:hypothetical protein [bacterium]MBU1063792.1 hypothetical protein [bacterium]MBU1635076.1 hypothetical protein [bacterium]MBU1874485.1 hypothetical protein [bacterium]